MAQKKVIFAVLIGTCSLWFARGALAASLSLTPAAGSYLVGHTFTVGIDVFSPDVAMNAAQGAVSFPANKLSVISLSKADSIMDLWVQDPSFSNRDGTINFGGVAVNPGFRDRMEGSLPLLSRYGIPAMRCCRSYRVRCLQTTDREQIFWTACKAQPLRLRILPPAVQCLRIRSLSLPIRP